MITFQTLPNLSKIKRWIAYQKAKFHDLYILPEKKEQMIKEVEQLRKNIIYYSRDLESGASAWDESIGFLIKWIMIDLILHEFKIIQDQWISFEIWTLNPWFCEVNYYFKYMAEECFMPVLAKLSVCDGKNGITMYCVFQ